jgi:ribosomal protein S18 acetylase RimI-like enzyme
MPTYRVRRLRGGDLAFVSHFLGQHGFTGTAVSRGRLHALGELPGFVVLRDSDPVGLVLYSVAESGLEIVVLHTLAERIGLGVSLLREVKKAARRLECSRVWVVVTNDDTRALRFYQRNGFRLVAFYPSARDEARRIEPGLPSVGADGIDVRDEIELEVSLASRYTETAAL